MIYGHLLFTGYYPTCDGENWIERNVNLKK